MMYFQQLYRTNKFWFLFVLIFALCQIFINYKQGIVITPLYHYGMYSKKVESIDSIELYAVKINGKVLQPFQFSAQEWDKLMVPVHQYCKIEKHNNDLFSKDIKRILNRLYLTADTSNFIVQKQPETFLNWYKNLLVSDENSSKTADTITAICAIKDPLTSNKLKFKMVLSGRVQEIHEK